MVHRDMSIQANRDDYDRLIFDGARDLAVAHGRNVSSMRSALEAMGVTDQQLLDIVGRNQTADDYEEIGYRGAMCDEGVIEALKDCLRPLHGF